MVFLKNNDICKEVVDTIIQLQSKIGTLKLKKNRYRRGLVFDYYMEKTPSSSKRTGYNSISRKMYFDLDDYIVENSSK